MQETDQINRQRSLSNNSSINTPKLRKRLNDIKGDSLVFSQILRKEKPQNLSENNSLFGDKQDNQSNASRMKNQQQERDRPMMKKTKEYMVEDISNSLGQGTKNNRRKPITPCQDLFPLLTNHAISQQYIQQMQKHRFKHLVIVSVILPSQLMKKITKFIDFSQQYKISIPDTLFSTEFVSLIQEGSKYGGNKQNDQTNNRYVYWTYELGERSSGDNLRNSLNLAYSDKYSHASGKSARDHHNKRRKMSNVSNVEQYSCNLKSLLVEIPQILITTKAFIKQNTQLFFPQLLADVININPSFMQPQKFTLQPQLNVQKTLLYFDEQQIDRSQQSIPTPRYMQTTPKIVKETKTKNSELKDNSYIEIQPEEEYYDAEEKQRERRPMLKKGQIDKLNTVRSDDMLSEEKQSSSRDQNIQLFQLLEKQSIFRHVNYLQPFWLENESHHKDSYEAKETNQRKRKNSLSVKNAERDKLQKFKLLLNQEIKISLKRNYHYARFCSSWIFLHFLTNFYQNSVLPNAGSQALNNSNDEELYTGMLGLSYTSLLVKSIKSFKKQIQLSFFQRVQNQYKSVVDESTLRNMLRNIKMQELSFMKKNFSSIVFPNNSAAPSLQSYKNIAFNTHENTVDKEFMDQIQQEIIIFMDSLEQELDSDNNKQAIIINEKILEAEYERIVETGLRRERLKKKESLDSNSSLNSDQRPLSLGDTTIRKKLSTQTITSELQKDFINFMQAYSLKSIKVASQMKTFNYFMQKTKPSYLKSIYQLTKQKKSHEIEEQQKENKNRMIKLLEMEIFKLEDKKREVKDKNEKINKKIGVQKQVAEREKNEASLKKEHKLMTRNSREERSAAMSGTDRFRASGEKSKSVFDPQSSRNNKRLKKSTSFSFQIQNNLKKNTTGSSFEKDGKKSKSSWYDKNENSKYGKRHQNLEGGRYNYRNQTIHEEEERPKKGRRCFNTCCEIM